MTLRIAEMGFANITSAGKRKAVCKDLTYRIYDHIEDSTSQLRDYYSCSRGLGMPRQYAVSYAAMEGIEVVDRTSLGSNVEFPKHVDLHEYQKPWVRDIVAKFRGGSLDVVAQAGTGKGKTVMSCEIAARLGVTTLVVVDQEFLRDQWIDTAQKFIGVDRSSIGVIQGSKCEYKDKDFVVATVQTLYQKDFEEELYKYFGLVIFDEVHTVGAEQFSLVLGMFPARYRLGVSATPDRGDDLQKVLDNHLGRVSVRLAHRHTKSTVRYIEYGGVLSWYANVSSKTGRYISEIMSDSERNELLVLAIKWMYESGRDVLAVSDRIEHLEALMSMARFAGVPECDMGIIAGYRKVWAYAKDPTPARKPQGLERGAEYTPVCLQYLSKRIPKATLNETKSTTRILFATYGMFTKGVDVPRLSAGMDCTPRSKAKQVHGRILRSMEGKMVPIWATIWDKMSYKAGYQFVKRIAEYRESNAEVYQWSLDKGTRRQDAGKLAARVRNRVADLKLCKIVTGPDGSNTVITPSTEKQQKREADKRTGRSTRRRVR